LGHPFLKTKEPITKMKQPETVDIHESIILSCEYHERKQMSKVLKTDTDLLTLAM
jgi:hypothetical protein